MIRLLNSTYQALRYDADRISFFVCYVRPANRSIDFWSLHSFTSFSICLFVCLCVVFHFFFIFLWGFLNISRLSLLFPKLFTSS